MTGSPLPILHLSRATIDVGFQARDPAANCHNPKMEHAVTPNQQESKFHVASDPNTRYGGIRYPPNTSEILPGLHLGNVESSEDPDTYRRQGIATRISLLTFKPDAWSRDPAVVDAVRPGSDDELFIPLADLPTTDLLEHLDGICCLIDEGLARRPESSSGGASAAAAAEEPVGAGKDSPGLAVSSSSVRTIDSAPQQSSRSARYAVLVHCEAGVSRSASAVIAYVMKKKKLSFEEARALVVGKRPRVLPNAGFCEQLAVWESAGYSVWKDEGRTIPREEYARWLAARRAGVPAAAAVVFAAGGTIPGEGGGWGKGVTAAAGTLLSGSG